MRIPSALRRSLIKTLGRPTPAGAANGRILIFKPDRLGDFVLASATIARLAEHFGPDRVTLLVSDFSAPLARWWFPELHTVSIPMIGNSLGRRLIGLLVEHRALFKRLKGAHLICLRHQRGIGEELLLNALQPVLSLGIENPGHLLLPGEGKIFRHAFSGSAPYPTTAFSDGCLDLESHRRVLELALHRTIHPTEILPQLFKHNSAPLAQILVVPFASSSERDLPLPLLMQSLPELLEAVPGRIVLCASPADRPRLATLAAGLNSCGPVEIASTPDIESFVNQVVNSRLILSADTSAAHLATAFDRPAVILLSGAAYGAFGPWRRSPRQQWLTNPLPCFNCNYQCPYPEPLCLTGVSPLQLVNAARLALQANPSSLSSSA